MKKNVITYFDKALEKGADVPPPNGVIPLDEAIVTITGDILSIKLPSASDTHFLSKLKGENLYRFKHRDLSTLRAWHTSILQSQEVEGLHRRRAKEESQEAGD